MDYLSANKILVVDLASGQISESDLPEDLVTAKIGGAAINKSLYEQYQKEEPLIIGTGLLTGTLYPASAAAILSAASPRTGKLCHCPITLKVGLEFRFSGFDYIVIKGRSPKPVFLWIHDGVADIMDAAALWGKDTWTVTDSLRQSMGDDLIQTMVIGPAGEKGSDIAQVILNFWASADRFGLGKVFGEKQLKAVAFRGMGLLEIADAQDFTTQAMEILEDVKNGALAGKKGLGDILTAMGQPEAAAYLAPLVHRHSACFNTPYATNTFAFIDDDPKRLEESQAATPGVLISDADAVVGLKNCGLAAADACRVMRACAQQGVDAAAAAHLSKAAGLTDAAKIEAALPTLSGPVPLDGGGVFSPWCPTRPLFADFEDAGAADWWQKRQAVAYIFGIHPILAVMAPEIHPDDLLDLASVGTDLDLTPEALDQAVAYLLA